MTDIGLPTPALRVEDTRVSFSSLTRHRKCPQAWVYDSVRRLEVATTAGAARRDLGSWWHAVRAADSLSRGWGANTLLTALIPKSLRTGDSSPEVPVTSHLLAFGSLEVLRACDAWWRTLTDTERAAWEDKIGQDVPTLLRSMDDRWHERWADDLQHEEVLAVEVQWSREVPLTEGETFTLDGAVDEVYRDTRRGILVVRDHKSNSTIPVTETVDDLLDSQTHIYVWGVQERLRGAGLDTAGATWALSYDRSRTKPPSAPALTKSGGLSKATSDYDLATYLAFTAEPVPYPGLKKDGSGAGEYERDPAVVERLSSVTEREKWNDRTLTPVSLNVVRAHLRAAQDSRRAMESTLERFHASGDAPRNLTRMGCGFCDYRDLCLAELRAGGAQAGPDIDPRDFGLRGKP